jgi:hypothetical protein
MKIKKVLIWIGIILLVLLIGRNFFIKLGVQAGVKNVLGLKITIDKLNVGLFQSVVRIEGLTIYNPEGFKEETLAEAPLIYIDYELSSILKGEMHCTKIEVDIKEIIIIKNNKGEINLNSLKAIESDSDDTSTETDQEKKEEIEIKIEKLVLTLDHVRFVDYSRRRKPKERKIRVGIDHEEFENLNSVEEIVRVIILKTLISSGLNNIGVAVDKITGSLKRIRGIKPVKKLDKSIESGVDKIKEKTRNFFKKLKSSGKKD